MQIKKIPGLILFGLSLSMSCTYAETNGTRTLQDSRIQTATYVPNQVYNIWTKVGNAVLIELQDDEIIMNSNGKFDFFSGADDSYDKKVFRNKFVFKPVTANQRTNLIVITNKRTYHFQLRPVEKNGTPTYSLSFRNNSSYNYSTSNPSSFESYPGLRSYNYWGKGDIALKPRSVYDDGKFTYFDFSNLKEIPAIYKIDASGEENLVNFHTENNNQVIVHETATKFHLRKDRQVLAVTKKIVTKKQGGNNGR